MGLAEFLDVTSSTSCVVVVDGVLVHEWYADGVTADDRLLGNSATKSALALVTGIAVTRGRLELDLRWSTWFRSCAAAGTTAATLRHVLTMTTGLDWVEDYHDPDSAASRMIGRWRQGLGGIRDLIAEIAAAAAPGRATPTAAPTRWCSDWVRERATGQTFAEALAEVWHDRRRRAPRGRRPRRRRRRAAGSRWPPPHSR